MQDFGVIPGCKCKLCHCGQAMWPAVLLEEAAAALQKSRVAAPLTSSLVSAPWTAGWLRAPQAGIGIVFPICVHVTDRQVLCSSLLPSPLPLPRYCFSMKPLYTQLHTCARARARAHTHTHTHTHPPKLRLLPDPTFWSFLHSVGY